MAWLSSDVSYEDAVSLGLDVWEVLLSDWGNAATAGANFTFPAIGQKGAPSIHGVSIGPRSMVDRCFISYDRQQIITSAYSYLRPVSVDAPLLFQQPSNEGIVATAGGTTPFSASSVAIFPNQQGSVGDPSGNNAQFVFLNYRNSLGNQLAYATAAAAGRFITPLLHLYFHLKPGLAFNAKRAPQVNDHSGSAIGAAGRTLIGIIPVCGRKRVYVTMRCTQIATLEVGMIQNSTGALETIPAANILAAQPLGIPARIVIDPAEADFITIYSTQAVTGTVTYTVSAYD